jgi:hypothetical protein
LRDQFAALVRVRLSSQKRPKSSKHRSGAFDIG